MSRKAVVPDAWDDDWEALADKEASNPSPPAEPTKKPSSKVTKAQRRAQQAELNRQLWEEAEAPKTFHFLETRQSANVPLKSEFKPPPILLSRKPQSHKPPTEGVTNLSLSSPTANVAPGESSSDSESDKEKTLSPEERRAKAAKEREEKQRKYDEVRERLFGTTASNNASSGASTPGEVTPPRSATPNRGRGRGKGGTNANRADSSRPQSAKGTQKQLFDPNYTAKPETKREQPIDPKAIEPVRLPKGPDGSGRGGFGFAGRGGNVS